MGKFIILALPRSRTAWMAHFLSFGGRACGHDLAVECASIAEFEASFSEWDGSVETGAVLGWRVLLDRLPNVKVALVQRPLWQIYASFATLGLQVDMQDMELRAHMLDALAQQPGVLSLDYAQLGTFSGCQLLFNHCLDLGLEEDWWSECQAKNVQIDMRTRLVRLRENYPRLQSLRAEIVEENAKLVGGGRWQFN